MKRFLVIFVISLMAAGSCNAQLFHRNASKRAERGIFGKSLSRKKDVKVKEPRSVVSAKKKQEANERKLKKDYAAFVRRSRERSFEIQTPAVQERMKQNKINTELRDKAKKKNSRVSNKKAARKYK